MTFLLVPSKLFRSLSASDKHTVGPICSCKPVVPCGRIVVSSPALWPQQPWFEAGSRQHFAVGRRGTLLCFLPPHSSAGISV